VKKVYAKPAFTGRGNLKVVTAEINGPGITSPTIER